MRVLVLEDEQMLRSSMVRGLSKLPDVTVEGAGTLAEALVAIDAAAPDLILSDLDLPDRSGIELVGELATRRLKIPIVFISAYLKAYGSQIPPHAAVKVLEKPVELRTLRELVLEYVGTSRATVERSTPFELWDYVQLAAMGGHSVRIAVCDAEGRTGEVVTHRGQLWRAEDESGAGREALFRLLAAKSTSLDCRALEGDPGPRCIEGRWEELLLEAARLHDEGARASDGDEPLDRALERAFDAPEAAVPEPDDGFGAAMERGLEAMLAKDYPRALAAFEAAQQIRPDDRVVVANLTRLRDMGMGDEGGES
ncbi:MAG: response regulator [Myxococcota bacterium]|nr:response regulator [Myxococcota bacterium]